MAAQSPTSQVGAGVGGAALAAGGGFPPLLLAGLLSYAPGLIAGLLGGDPQKKLRKKLAKLTSAANVGKVTDEFYRQNIASPAFSQAQGTIAAGANATAGNVARQLGASGIGSSGTGALLSSLTPSIIGQQTAGLRTGAFQSAQQSAQENIRQQVAALTGTQGPSPVQSAFSMGTQAFSPFLSQYLQQKYPTFFQPQQQAA